MNAIRRRTRSPTPAPLTAIEPYALKSGMGGGDTPLKESELTDLQTDGLSSITGVSGDDPRGDGALFVSASTTAEVREINPLVRRSGVEAMIAEAVEPLASRIALLESQVRGPGRASHAEGQR